MGEAFGVLDHYQVKDGENDFAKALPVSPVVGLLLSSTHDWDKVKRRRSALDIFQCHYRGTTSKNGADFVHYVMPAFAPASHNGQSRA